VRGPQKKYEKIIQKLESDVRGHIRLEHEMKIHMDYLENKIELFQAQASTWEKEKARLIRQLETATDKLALVKESKDREIKDLNRKLTEMGNKLSSQLQRTNEVERKLSQERDNFSKKSVR
jgi:chromosome segregation ATPase